MSYLAEGSGTKEKGRSPFPVSGHGVQPLELTDLPLRNDRLVVRYAAELEEGVVSVSASSIFDPVTGAIDTRAPDARTQPVASDIDVTEQTAVGERTSSRL